MSNRGGSHAHVTMFDRLLNVGRLRELCFIEVMHQTPVISCFLESRLPVISRSLIYMQQMNFLWYGGLSCT